MINKSTKMAKRCSCGFWISGKMTMCSQCLSIKHAAEALIMLKYGKKRKRVTFC